MEPPPADSLQRRLGLTAAIAIVIANVIGTGVFLKARAMTDALGSPGWVMAAWGAAGLLSLAGTLTYAQLAVVMPHTGGEFSYLNRGYGRLWGFLFGWTQILVAKTGSQASAAVGFGIFLNDFCGQRLKQAACTMDLPWGRWEITWLQVSAVGLIALVTLLNAATIQSGGRIAAVLALTKIGLVLVVALGAFFLSDGDWGHFGMSAPATDTGRPPFAAGFAAAMLAALWAYDGWNSVTLVAGEVAHPQRNLPRALIGGILVVMALYLTVNAAYFFVLTPAEVASVPQESSVAREAASRFLGAGAAALMTAGLLASSLGTLHTSIMGGARIPYAMAREGLFWRWFGGVSPRTAVPVRALAFQGVWASLLALSGSFDKLTDYVVFGSWIFYGMAGSVFFVLRRKAMQTAGAPRIRCSPVIPAVFLASTLWLLVQTLLSGTASALAGLGIIAAGIPVYAFITRKGTSR